jgi:hypothetical protein
VRGLELIAYQWNAQQPGFEFQLKVKQALPCHLQDLRSSPPELYATRKQRVQFSNPRPTRSLRPIE